MDDHEHEWQDSGFANLEDCAVKGCNMTRVIVIFHYNLSETLQLRYHSFGQNSPAMCRRCGAMVWEFQAHDAFHEELNDKR